jgi:tetratricopeptide (TPR) repeat protein
MRQSNQVKRLSLVWLVGLLALLAHAAAPPAPVPPWQRQLRGPLAEQAAQLEARLMRSWEAGDFRAAAEAAGQLVRLREREQGRKHWQTENARWRLVAVERASRASPKDRDAFRVIPQQLEQVPGLFAQARYRPAQLLLEKALAIQSRVLGEEHPDTALGYNNLGYTLRAQGQYTPAQPLFDTASAIARKVLGEEHPDTAAIYNNLAMNLEAQGRYPEAHRWFDKALAIHRNVFGEEDPHTANSYNNLAHVLHALGQYPQAQSLNEKALTIRRRLLGEEHPDTALSCNNLAQNLQAQGQYAQAQRLYERALTILHGAIGEVHPNTARTYSNLASILQAQGQYPQGQRLYEKALTIHRKVLGEYHPDTAQGYNNLAVHLLHQGQFVQAEPLLHKALTIFRKVLGEEHPHTARSYSNLASNLQAQGRNALAQPLFEKTLAILRELLGEQHPLTAQAYSNLALNLQVQGEFVRAQPYHETALAIYCKLLGREHPVTALSYNNLACNLQAQGEFVRAGRDHATALAIRRKLLGEEHPDTAQSYHNLASNHDAQGDYIRAEVLHRKALAIRLGLLGEQHPDTAANYNNLATNLYRQGKYREAEQLATQAAENFSRTRLRITSSGLDRVSFTRQHTPFPLLAVLLARRDQPALAWQRFEQSLGQGIGDDFAVRLQRPLAERQRQAHLLGRLRYLDSQLQQLAAVRNPTATQQEQRQQLLAELLQKQNELAKLYNDLEAKYGAAAGRVLPLAELQKALPADAAFLAWLDLRDDEQRKDSEGEHWAILLKASGQPVQVRLVGSGLRGAWTKEDRQLPTQLQRALGSPGGKWQPLAERLRQQRLAPLEAHLKGIRHLIVLPSSLLDGVPIEVLAERRTVSYAPSAGLFYHLRQLPRPKSEGVLALADPALERPARPLPPLPASGLLVRFVGPNSLAGKAGVEPGDVLLKYGEHELRDLEQLRRLIKDLGREEEIELTLWRDGQTFVRPVPPGQLGVALDRQPARQALKQQREIDRLLERTRGEDHEWQPLPGSRLEAQALRRLLVPKQFTLLAGSDASEQKLDEMARRGQLQNYRYLHLATHGLPDRRNHLQSALILARDRLPDPVRQLQAGRLTAEKVLQDWNLDCDLVTLSACQSGLGKHESGEGFVGFAQAFLLAGSRSVVVSLWKVDDTATALLMDRFYQNLLGRREGMKGPLTKAEALAEAKSWLRTLSRAEALKRGAELVEGVERAPQARLDRPPEPPRPAAGVKDEAARPYEHPYYWAAFVLIGRHD